jgi:hypothetical protein
MDDKVGTRKVVTEGTSVNNRGGFFVPVTGVTLRNSMAFLDHINGRKYNQELGYSMRVERKGASEVAEKLKALKDKQTAATEAAGVMAAASATGEDLSRAAYDVRVRAAEEEEEARRAKERERRKRRRKKKHAQTHDDEDEDEDMGAAEAGMEPSLPADSSSTGATPSASSSSSSSASSSSSGAAVGSSSVSAGIAGALNASLQTLRQLCLQPGIYGVGPTSGMVDPDLAAVLGVSAGPAVPWNSPILQAL